MYSATLAFARAAALRALSNVLPQHSPSILTMLFFGSALFAVSALTAAAQTTSFSNTANITVTDNSTATPYPSTLNVSGLTGQVTRVTVSLNNITHQEPDDMDVVLVGPTGVVVSLIQDSGGANTATGQTWTFDDRAAAMMTDGGPAATGTFKPSDGTGGANLPAPAPAGPYSFILSDFIGTDPNGSWRLYIDDDSNTDGTGNIAGGWTINITTGAVFTNATSIGIPDNTIATLYPSNISVTGVGVINKVTIRLNNLSHTWPEDIGVLLVGPGGQKVRLMTDAGGGTGAAQFTNADITFDDTAVNLVPDATPPLESTFRPTQGNDSAAGGSDPHAANFPAPAPAGPYGLALSAFNGTIGNGTWNLYVDDDTGDDAGTMAGGWTLMIESVLSSAASVELNGRVLTADGRGIKNVAVTITGGNLDQPRTVYTGTFGNYTFDGIPAGQSYIVSVAAKRYFFSNPLQVVTLNDNLKNFNFVADQ